MVERSGRPLGAPVTRIVILGGPKTGKTTLANTLAAERERAHARAGTTHGPARHTDDLIPLGWSEASQAASLWFDEPGPWIIEGVAAVRALRKWREQHPGEPPPVDRVIYLTTPVRTQTAGQAAMGKGVRSVYDDIEGWLAWHGIVTEYVNAGITAVPE